MKNLDEAKSLQGSIQPVKKIVDTRVDKVRSLVTGLDFVKKFG